ncbi:hypothetical protein AB0G34_32815, partial [Kitasatospora aureofaciens]
MGRAGRGQGPLRGRTEQANTLARYVRDLTADRTGDELHAQYGGVKSVWSEYRSGAKIIPWERLEELIKDRFPHAPERETELQTARRRRNAALRAQTELSSAAVAPPSAPASSPGRERAAPGGERPANNSLTSEDVPGPPSEQSAHEEPALEGDGSGDRARTVPGKEVTGGSQSGAGPADGATLDPAAGTGTNPLLPAGTGTDLLPRTGTETPRPPAGTGAGSRPSATPASPSTAGPSGSRPAGAPDGSRPNTRGGWRRWRTPAQWAALLALLAAVVVANQNQQPRHGEDTAAPAVTASPNGLSLPSDLNLPSSSLPGAPATAAVTPSGEAASPLSASGPAASVPTPGRIAPSSPAGGVPPAAAAAPGGPTVAATGAHLYRITPDHAAVEEYTGKDGAWTKVRGAAGSIFTSATTLYATDPASGDIEQYDRGRGTWTRI